MNFHQTINKNKCHCCKWRECNITGQWILACSLCTRVFRQHLKLEIGHQKLYVISKQLKGYNSQYYQSSKHCKELIPKTAVIMTRSKHTNGHHKLQCFWVFFAKFKESNFRVTWVVIELDWDFLSIQILYKFGSYWTKHFLR